MPPPVTAASLSTADAGYIENDDEPWHSTCVSKAPVITKGAFDQAYVSSLPFVAPEEALQLAMSKADLKLKDIDGAIAKCVARLTVWARELTMGLQLAENSIARNQSILSWVHLRSLAVWT